MKEDEVKLKECHGGEPPEPMILTNPYLPMWSDMIGIGASHTPIIRDKPKIGRNDPCPCNSGKKYKKCCL